MNLDHLTRSANGCYGSYFKVSDEVGIKVIGYVPVEDVDNGHPTHIELSRSDQWKSAKEEFNVLLRVESTGITPKPIQLLPVTLGGKLYPGIMMSHIEGRTMCTLTNDYQFPYDEMDKIRNNLQKTLEASGIWHDDMNPGNIMQGFDGKHYVLDWDRHYIKFDTDSVKGQLKLIFSHFKRIFYLLRMKTRLFLKKERLGIE